MMTVQIMVICCQLRLVSILSTLIRHKILNRLYLFECINHLFELGEREKRARERVREIENRE